MPTHVNVVKNNHNNNVKVFAAKNSVEKYIDSICHDYRIVKTVYEIMLDQGRVETVTVERVLIE